MNHFPHEIISQIHCQSRILIRETAHFVGKYAFRRKFCITTVVFPPSIEINGECSFKGCLNLCNVNFKGNSRLKKICSNSFSNTLITKVIFPLSVEEIDEEAFSYCKNLSSILFPIDSKLKAI